MTQQRTNIQVIFLIFNLFSKKADFRLSFIVGVLFLCVKFSLTLLIINQHSSEITLVAFNFMTHLGHLSGQAVSMCVHAHILFLSCVCLILKIEKLFKSLLKKYYTHFKEILSFIIPKLSICANLPYILIVIMQL